MGDGSNIKLTLYKWLTPKGNWIHKQGFSRPFQLLQPGYFLAGLLQLKEPLKPDMNNNEIKRAQFLLKGLVLSPAGKTAITMKAQKKPSWRFRQQQAEANRDH